MRVLKQMTAHLHSLSIVACSLTRHSNLKGHLYKPVIPYIESDGAQTEASSRPFICVSYSGRWRYDVARLRGMMHCIQNFSQETSSKAAAWDTEA
jgi:hypothetical protein